MRRMVTEKQIEGIVKQNSTKLYKHSIEFESGNEVEIISTIAAAATS